jgi:xanthine/CO dehydrogenase XdhC/CoxF family maturation factor
MSEIDAVLDAARRLQAAGEPVALATVVSVRGSSYRRPGARLLVPRDSSPIGLISGGCLEEEAARLARRAIDEDAPLLVTIDHSAEGDELWGLGLGCRGVIELLAEPPTLAAATLEALVAARSEGRATYQLTSLDGTRRQLTATEAASLGEAGRRSSARASSIRSCHPSIWWCAAPVRMPRRWWRPDFGRDGGSMSSTPAARGCVKSASLERGCLMPIRPRPRTRPVRANGPRRW